ncbi:MAG: glycine cleavage system protein H [Bdellovibrionales bacterium]|nr:glycine cleavage system protein H [Bdellovibrionales bacterium]
MSAKFKEFAENLWFQIEGDIVTVGILEEALSNLEVVRSIHLSEEGESVESDQIVGDVNADEESVSIYTPCSGEIIEVNEAVLENPRLIYEDPTGESWLFRVRADDEDELASLNEEEKLEVTDTDGDDDDLLDDDDDIDYGDGDLDEDDED